MPYWGYSINCVHRQSLFSLVWPLHRYAMQSCVVLGVCIDSSCSDDMQTLLHSDSASPPMLNLSALSQHEEQAAVRLWSLLTHRGWHAFTDQSPSVQSYASYKLHRSGWQTQEVWLTMLTCFLRHVVKLSG
jgi:hypothetical protein